MFILPILSILAYIDSSGSTPKKSQLESQSKISGKCFNAPVNFCTSFTDNFDTLNTRIWRHETTNGGGGNGEFQTYVDNRSNSYVKNGVLYLRPTLSNNVVQSAKLTTKGTLSMKYGRVEFKARLPKGDWIWPAIWMMPNDSKYGDWPRSGEIDIMESRGNGRSTINSFSSAAHWGRIWNDSKWYMTHGDRKNQWANFNKDFHTFGLEWTPNYLRTYLDKPTNIIMDIPLTNFDAFSKGGFSGENPWQGGCPQAPFEQEFYLLLNVAVGSTNGYFPDGNGKPWSNSDGANARSKFLNAKEEWLSTLDQDGEKSALAIDSVTVWNLC